jgi:phosphate:Na+ symporter
MKESVLDIAMVLDFQAFAGLPLLVFFCIGLFFSILMQSSTAMNVINLTALFAGIVTFPMAAMISLGAELGTTSSAVFASFS